MSKKIVFVILFLFLVGLGTVLVMYRDAWFDYPWRSETGFSYPQYAVSSGGDVYVIDTSFRRILRLNADGQIVFSLEGGFRDERSFFYAQDLVVGEQGELYVLNVVLDTFGMYTEREEILRYSPEGAFQGIVHQRLYSEQPSTLVQRGRIAGLRREGIFLYWLEVSDNQIVGYRYSTDRGILEEVDRYDYPDASIYLSDIDWSGTEGFVATTKYGQIVECFWDEEPRVLFDGEEGPARVVPWDLERSNDGTIWFVDLASRAVLRRNADGQVDTVLSHGSLVEEGFTPQNLVFYRLNLGADGMLATFTEDSIIVFDGDGRIATFRQEFRYSDLDLFYRWAGWTGILIGFFCLIGFVIRLYRDIFRRRLSLIVKQIFILVPLLIVSIFIISNMIIQNSISRLSDEKTNKIASMAQNFALMADPVDFEGLDSQTDYMNQHYRAIRDLYHTALNGNRDSWNQGFYYAIYRVIDDQLYGLMYYNDRIGMFHPFTWFTDPESVYRRAYDGAVVTEQISDDSGDWLYAVAPVAAADGSIAALIEVGTDLYSFRAANEELKLRTFQLVGIVTAVIILILVFTTWLVLRALRILRKGVNEIAARNWDVRVHVRGRDEVYDLANTFNDMAQSIKNYLGHIEELNVSYKRFVPHEFLLYLDKPSVIDARLGDQVQKEMTILFSDIRSFTSLSEKMTPKENFDFLNTYLSAVGPYIRTHGGFIDKYIGDAIMALFPRAAEDAVAAAIDMRTALLDFNKSREANGQEPIDIGTGIHTGNLMLGILGEAERREGTVISDNVNLASRLEYLTKQYGAPTILSQTVYERLPNPERFNLRYLGRVRVKGKTAAMAVYELIDGQSQADRVRKIVAKEGLEAAIRLYEGGDFPAAMNAFDELLERHPMEKVAMLYRQASSMYIKAGMKPKDWDGSITLKDK